jgi:hypothetical protein
LRHPLQEATKTVKAIRFLRRGATRGVDVRDMLPPAGTLATSRGGLAWTAANGWTVSAPLPEEGEELLDLIAALEEVAEPLALAPPAAPALAAAATRTGR